MNSSMTLRYISFPDARRFFIERADRCWTGEEWAVKRSAARLFADLRSAHEEYNRLQLEPFYGKPVREFECSLTIRVHGDGDFTLEELQAWLLLSLRITLDVEAKGDGPIDGVFVVPVVILESLRKVEQF